jgi:hypothetical protein
MTGFTGMRSKYLDLRRPYEPSSITLVIVAESPPASGRYFYDPTGAVTEPLFAAVMKLLHLSPKTKEDGLRSLQRNGWILIDATYEPVNKLTGSSRDAVIGRDYTLLCDDLAALRSDPATPLILIKKNVCRLLEPKLTADGFNVLNRGRDVYFPSNGRQADFHRQFREIIEGRG